MASFTTLFTPQASRMFAQNDRAGINDLYWRSAIWIAIFSFPIFVLTFSLAHPITIILYGSRYAHAAPIMALLSVGYYFNAATGFNGLTLKVCGKVRYIVLMSVATALLSLVVSLILVPKMGAIGAGIATMVGLLIHNVLKQAGLRLGTGVSLFEWHYVRVYVVIALCALGFLAIQIGTSASVYVSLGFAVLASYIVFRKNRKILEVGRTFPEVMRIPAVRFLVSGRWGAPPEVGA